jgi:hypothetical protein
MKREVNIGLGLRASEAGEPWTGSLRTEQEDESMFQTLQVFPEKFQC